MPEILHPLINALWQAFFALLPLVMVFYGFALMFLGPQRAVAFMSGMCSGVFRIGFTFLGWLFGRAFCFVFKLIVNTSTLLARLSVSLGQPDKVTEAWAKYLERMADAVL